MIDYHVQYTYILYVGIEFRFGHVSFSIPFLMVRLIFGAKLNTHTHGRLVHIHIWLLYGIYLQIHASYLYQTKTESIFQSFLLLFLQIILMI